MTVDETRRVEHGPRERFHYRALAADHAEAAAELLPRTSQAYAAMLCRAGSYVERTDLQRAQELYHLAIVTGPPLSGATWFSSCPEPEWEQAAAQLPRPWGAWILGVVAALALASAVAWWRIRHHWWGAQA
jgi:hypothetical protein